MLLVWKKILLLVWKRILLLDGDGGAHLLCGVVRSDLGGKGVGAGARRCMSCEDIKTSASESQRHQWRALPVDAAGSRSADPK